MAVGKKLRFEVFKRDSFTCQYCGKSAPEVVLEIDHIQPRKEGGTDDVLNLITSCFDCNRGKGSRKLSDKTTVQKRKKQLDLIQKRREQLEMLVEWQQSLLDLDKEAVDGLVAIWNQLAPGHVPTEKGRDELRRWNKRFGFNEVVDAMRASVLQYYDGCLSTETQEQHDSAMKAFEAIPRICAVERQMKTKPYLRELYYVRGILRNRINYFKEWKAFQALECAIKCGVDTTDLKELAKSVSTWKDFEEQLEVLKAEAQKDKS